MLALHRGNMGPGGVLKWANYTGVKACAHCGGTAHELHCISDQEHLRRGAVPQLRSTSCDAVISHGCALIHVGASPDTYTNQWESDEWLNRGGRPTKTWSKVCHMRARLRHYDLLATASQIDAVDDAGALAHAKWEVSWFRDWGTVFDLRSTTLGVVKVAHSFPTARCKSCGALGYKALAHADGTFGMECCLGGRVKFESAECGNPSNGDGGSDDDGDGVPRNASEIARFPASANSDAYSAAVMQERSLAFVRDVVLGASNRTCGRGMHCTCSSCCLPVRCESKCGLCASCCAVAFNERSRWINSRLAMVSFEPESEKLNGRRWKGEPHGEWRPQVAVGGRIQRRIGALHASGKYEPGYMQLFVLDAAEASAIRARTQRHQRNASARSRWLDRAAATCVRRLDAALRLLNPYVQDFRTAASVLLKVQTQISRASAASQSIFDPAQVRSPAIITHATAVGAS